MQDTGRIFWKVFATAFLFLVGSSINMLAYSSVEPLFVAIIFWVAGMTLLYVTALGGRFERAMFSTVFSVGWFMASVAAVYVIYLNDPFQSLSDAASFFELSRGSAHVLGIEEIKVLTEGAGAVVLWRAVYDGLAVLGFEKGRYVGVVVNVFAVAFTGVIAVKTARLLYGDDVSRLNRLISLFSFCGLFWLFAAIHLRDAFVLLGVTSIAYVWTLYLTKPEIRNLILLIAASFVAFALLGFLRTEFVFVPIVMLFAGLTAISMFQKARGSRKLIIYGISFFGFIIAYVLFLKLQTELFSALTGGSEGYLEHAKRWSSANSLGMALIVNQALPLRLLLGAIYLFVFPIPFWTGFQLESAYHLFKSGNVIFFYFVTPLFALSILRMSLFKAVRTPALMFNLFLALGFTLAIAGTSLETRHFGAFLVPLFLVALLPDFGFRTERRVYWRLFLLFLLMIIVVHIVWIALKSL